MVISDVGILLTRQKQTVKLVGRDRQIASSWQRFLKVHISNENSANDLLDTYNPHHCNGWILKSYRYITKITLGPATSKVQNKHAINTCCRNRTNVLWRSKAAPIKMYNTCQHKRGLKRKLMHKKWPNTFAPGSTCLPQKVLRTSGLYGNGTDGLSLNLPP